MAKPILRTELCDMLGIEYPILSAGMGPTLIGERAGAPVELVVAVSEAGGLGVLGGSGFSVDGLRDAIRQIKSQTDKPFGVDLLLPQKLDLSTPVQYTGYEHESGRSHGDGGNGPLALHPDHRQQAQASGSETELALEELQTLLCR